MAEKKVNYNKTKIEAIQSQAEIIKELTLVGFNETGQHSKDGITTVFGSYRGANFMFKTDIPQVVDKLVSEASDGMRWEIENQTEKGDDYLIKIKEQAIRVAWRHTYHYVKAVCACINLKTIELGHAFAGHLAIHDDQGALVTMGTQITKQIALGQFEPTHIFNKFAIEDKSNVSK